MKLISSICYYIYIYIYIIHILTVGPATVRFEDDVKDMTFSSSKTYLSALKELKSSDAAIEFKTRNDGLSKLQIRRKSTKMEEISGNVRRY
jgi:hypothetical protein